MTTMDQIHRIRELFYEQGKNLNEIAIIMNCDWRTVRKYVDMEDFSSPPPAPLRNEEHSSKLDPFKPQIDSWMEADKLAPRKQRHTAKRIYKRLKSENQDFSCSYRLVALYVRQRKEKLNLNKTTGYIPLKHRPISVQPIFTKMGNSTTKQNILYSASHTVTAAFSSLIMEKTWNACWKVWLPYLST